MLLRNSHNSESPFMHTCCVCLAELRSLFFEPLHGVSQTFDSPLSSKAADNGVVAAAVSVSSFLKGALKCDIDIDIDLALVRMPVLITITFSSVVKFVFHLVNMVQHNWMIFNN